MNRIEIYNKHIDFDSIVCIYVKDMFGLQGEPYWVIYADEIEISKPYQDKNKAYQDCQIIVDETI